MPGFPEHGDGASTLALHRNHSLPGGRVCISWGRGNKLRLSYLQQPSPSPAAVQDSCCVATTVMEVRVGGSDTEWNGGEASTKRRLAYESLSPYALLQSRKQRVCQSEEDTLPSDWWETVLDYSRSISAILEPNKSHSGAAIKQLTKVPKETGGPNVLKAIWDLLEIIYVDKNAFYGLPEHIVDWLQSYDRVLSSSEPTIYSKLATFQAKLSNMRFPEDDKEYWDSMASALAVGWLDVVVNCLRMHGSYQHDQIDDRQTENGLVEAVVVLISNMPRMRLDSKCDSLGITYNFKPDFSKAWERWRNQIAKLNGSSFWSDCKHQGTLFGLKKLLVLLLGDLDTLVAATTHWMELLASHFLFIRPFTVLSEGMLSLARKCVQLKPPPKNDRLLELILAIMGEHTEVVLLECSNLFGPWMLTHMVELLSAKNTHAQALLCDKMDTLGGVSLEELHRLVYAQLLSSHPCSWQLAPLYLAYCPQQGRALLENLLLMQPISDRSRLTLKVLDVCRIYDFRIVAEKIMRVMGVHHWKHGKKGTGISWLRYAHDDRRLSAVANELLTMVSHASSVDSDRLQFREIEGLVDLLGLEFEGFGGLSFLHRYRDFKMVLHNFQEKRAEHQSSQKLIAIGKEATKCLMQLMKGAVPQEFWLPLLQDSVELLEFPEDVLLTVAEINILLMKMQDLSLCSMRGNAQLSVDPTQSLGRLRLALATKLGRAILKE